MKEVRKSMIRNAQAYNKYLTDEYLDKCSRTELLVFVHPSRREYYIKLMERK